MLHYQTPPHPLCRLLWPVSLVYQQVIDRRNQHYNRQPPEQVKLPIPVISVGNLTTGGTGKTPVTIALAQRFCQQGLKVVVLSRGYGAKTPQTYAVATHPNFGDEPYLIQQHVPQATVIVGPNRSQNALRAMSDYRPDVVLLDDGFQHRKLARDVDILLVDRDRGFGNGWLLPAGPLREPVRELWRATQVWVTHCSPGGIPVALLQQLHQNQAAEIQAIPFTLQGVRPFQAATLNQAPTHSANKTEALLPAHILRDKHIVAISGIAYPQRFEQLLAQSGLSIQQQFRFPDHHNYRASEVHALVQGHDPNKTVWITTEKDRTKLERLLPQSLLSSFYTTQLEPVLPQPLFPAFGGSFR
ncbi:MAG: tetraacyldisaccharide 4'-kinase [Candidatus Melainabacteria bacterium]|nr:tetraacyldisaccharide 4'-kinase [Candidatus Melainabacteria bacterium]